MEEGADTWRQCRPTSQIELSFPADFWNKNRAGPRSSLKTHWIVVVCWYGFCEWIRKHWMSVWRRADICLGSFVIEVDTEPNQLIFALEEEPDVIR